jgi:HAD superfamily hydrolase (TIGR01549 family)
MITTARAVIFDMDGTLTRQNLDFALIRGEMGLGGESVLEAIERMGAADQARALAILERHEAEAAATCELHAGAGEVVDAVRASGLAAVLMTRNSRKSVDVFQTRHDLRFDLVWTREDGPMKPSPEPILLICRKLTVRPAEAWVVGDFHYDILCGAAAGAKTVLFVEPGAEPPPWAEAADYVIHDLRQLLKHLDIRPTAPDRRRRMVP